ncbi:hypothetical protein, partial [Ruminococcus sp. RTP21484sp1]|uniref:hypothetical protein n=1 Tax=Ruminococcus sp. RTP21484sp1 TaxID=3151395 RepID=UPI00321911E5
LEHSQIFVDFEENKKKRSFKRKMVLGITPNTKFVYSLRAGLLSRSFTVWEPLSDIHSHDFMPGSRFFCEICL